MIDHPTYFHKEMRTARKSHKCCECMGIISKGEQYEYVKGTWGREFMTFATCKHCLEVWKGCVDDRVFGELIEFARDCWPPNDWSEAFIERYDANIVKAVAQ